ncbi:SAF domain-containing protein [Propionibacteriaceae bacterium Y1923]|uniref:SAF domain-containing protein n=1 Tax=Aestuariimicrobium sp. Y1814 TaxID=3418742 RepID=UPI003C2330F8
MSENSPPRPWRTRLTTFLRWHRRWVAAVAAGVAVLASLTVLSPAAPDHVEVVVTTADLPAGHRLTAGDLRVVGYPPELVPGGAAGTSDELLGRVLVAASPRGSPLGSHSVIDSTRVPEGRLLVPVRVDDPAVLALLRVGDQITVIGSDDAGTPVVLARRVRIAAVPQVVDEGVLDTGGSASGVVVVDVDEQTAVRLSAWASNPGLSVSLG